MYCVDPTLPAGSKDTDGRSPAPLPEPTIDSRIGGDDICCYGFEHHILLFNDRHRVGVAMGQVDEKKYPARAQNDTVPWRAEVTTDRDFGEARTAEWRSTEVWVVIVTGESLAQPNPPPFVWSVTRATQRTFRPKWTAPPKLWPAFWNAWRGRDSNVCSLVSAQQLIPTPVTHS